MTISATILSAAKLIGVPGALLLAICTHETGLHNVYIDSDNGSPTAGVCMIKESTARSMGYKGIVTGPLKKSKVFDWAMEPDGKPEGLMIPSVNAKYAAKYLKKKLEENDGDWCRSTASYNLGHYKPSKKHPGKPVNYGYIKLVLVHLDSKYKDYLICGKKPE